jgi:hypothetical protein
VVGETARVVHVVPLSTDAYAGAVGAVCGAGLPLEDIETVTPGQGMPCIVCVITHATRTPPNEEPPMDGPDNAATAGLAIGGVCYQQWDWPVTVHRDQVRLSLDRDVSALAIPIPLCTEVTNVLAARHCSPAVLAHPHTPDHHLQITGERYGVALPRCTRSSVYCCSRPPSPHAGRSPGHGPRGRSPCGCAAKSICLPRCTARYSMPYPAVIHPPEA